MLSRDVFRARAFRLALAFCLAVSVATAAVFALIYLQVSRADVQQVGAVLVDEAAKSEGDSEERLREALELRLTRDIRRLDFVALINSKGDMVFGNVPAMPPIPIDGRAHRRSRRASAGSARRQGRPPSSSPAVARTEACFCSDAACGRTTTCRRRCCARSRSALVADHSADPRRSARSSPVAPRLRLERIHGAIVSIMNGEFHSRLPVANDRDDVDKVARAVNLMLDEIERLLDQLKSVGDNIAHDLRTPLMVARAKLERALEEDAGIQPARATMRARPRPDRQGLRHHRGDPARLGRRKRRPAETVQGLRPRRRLRRGGRVLSAARRVEVRRDDHRGRRARSRPRRRGPDARGDLEPRRQRGQVHARKAAACASRRPWSTGCRELK